jgi:hypothetical protein
MSVCLSVCLSRIFFFFSFLFPFIHAIRSALLLREPFLKFLRLMASPIIINTIIIISFCFSISNLQSKLLIVKIYIN